MTYYNKKQFTPRKPVRSFRDLEVYQKPMECAVIIAKDIKPQLIKAKYEFLETMGNCCMSVPLLVAQSHSIRFADFAQGLAILEKAMAGCNKMVVYLEQIKGVYGSKVNAELIDDIINRYMDARGKMFRLEKSWKRFRENNSETEKKTSFKY